MTIKIDVETLMKLIEQAVASFGSEHHLSDWERGQMDGLYWAKQLIEMMQEEKNPPGD
jgi:hypothetical protein